MCTARICAHGYAVCVRRTTVMLPDELDHRLRFESRRRGVSVAEVIREALDARYGLPPGPRKLSFVGIGEARPGTPTDAASRIDELLGEDLWRSYLEDKKPSDADR